MASSSRACSGGGLVRPGGPVRHREQRPARAAGQRQRPQARVRAGIITRAHGAEERPVRGRVRHPDQRPVQRPRRQRPAPADGHRTRAAPVLRAPARPAAAPASRSSSSGTGPSAFRQSPAARADAGRHGRAHGTSARSPASAAITSPDPRVRHQRHQHDHPDHERPGQQPFPLPLHEPARPAAPSPRSRRSRPARPGLQPFLQRPQRRVMHRAALRPDLPVPPDLRLRDRHHLAEHDRAARADLLRPPDDQRGPVPAAQRPCRSSAATPAAPAAPRPSSRPRRARHTTGQGKKKTREAPVEEVGSRQSHF